MITNRISINDLLKVIYKNSILIIAVNLFSLIGINYFYNNNVLLEIEYSFERLKPPFFQDKFPHLSLTNILSINQNVNIFFCDFEIPPYKFLAIRDKDLKCEDGNYESLGVAAYNRTFYDFHAATEMNNFYYGLLKIKESLNINELNEYFNELYVKQKIDLEIRNTLLNKIDEIFYIIKRSQILLKKDEIGRPINILFRYKYHPKISIDLVNEFLFFKTKQLLINEIANRIEKQIISSKQLSDLTNNYIKQANKSDNQKMIKQKLEIIKFFEDWQKSINKIRNSENINNPSLILEIFEIMKYFDKEYNSGEDLTNSQISLLIISDILNMSEKNEIIFNNIINYLNNHEYENYLFSYISKYRYDLD